MSKECMMILIVMLTNDKLPDNDTCDNGICTHYYGKLEVHYILEFVNLIMQQELIKNVFKKIDHQQKILLEV